MQAIKAGDVAERDGRRMGKGRQIEWRDLRRFVPLALLGLGLAAFFGFGLQDFLSLDRIAQHRDMLLRFVGTEGGVAVALYVSAYAVATALSIPGGLFFSILGGFLFGLWAGTLYAVAGASLGAIAVFLAARTAFRDTLTRRAGPFVKRLESGFRNDALSYLLALRLLPLFPFWLVNLVPALLGVPLGTYVIGTVVGIIPGTFVYASVGNGFGAVLDEGGTPDLGLIFSFDVLLPIIGLAALALVPVVYRRLSERKVAVLSKDGVP